MSFMKFFSLLFLLFYPDLALSQAAQPKILVGTLTEQWTPHCRQKSEGDYELEWIDPHYEVGFVRLIFDSKMNVADFLGKVVIVKGHPVAGYGRPDTDAAIECDESQRRADFVTAKNGVRFKRNWPAAVANTAAWAVAAIELFPVSWRAASENLSVDLQSPFPEDLQDVVITAHYNSCPGYGKMASMTRVKKFQRIKANQAVSLDFPALIADALHYKIHSVQITVGGPDMVFDWDYPLSKDEAPWVCPPKT